MEPSLSMASASQLVTQTRVAPSKPSANAVVNPMFTNAGAVAAPELPGATGVLDSDLRAAGAGRVGSRREVIERAAAEATQVALDRQRGRLRSLRLGAGLAVGDTRAVRALDVGAALAVTDARAVRALDVGAGLAVRDARAVRALDGRAGLAGGNARTVRAIIVGEADGQRNAVVPVTRGDQDLRRALGRRRDEGELGLTVGGHLQVALALVLDEAIAANLAEP